MRKNTFIQFDENNSTVELTLRFRVNETENTHFVPKRELTVNLFKEIVVDALEKRMEHCQNILRTKILPMSDCVFTPTHIYSNERGLHFSINAFNAMEEAHDTILSSEVQSVGELMSHLSLFAVQQCLKAVCNHTIGSVRSRLYTETIDALTEALLVKE